MTRRDDETPQGLIAIGITLGLITLAWFAAPRLVHLIPYR